MVSATTVTFGIVTAKTPKLSTETPRNLTVRIVTANAVTGRNPAPWSVKSDVLRPSRHCRDSRVYGHTTTAMHDKSIPPLSPARAVTNVYNSKYKHSTSLNTSLVSGKYPVGVLYVCLPNRTKSL